MCEIKKKKINELGRWEEQSFILIDVNIFFSISYNYLFEEILMKCIKEKSDQYKYELLVFAERKNELFEISNNLSNRLSNYGGNSVDQY